MVVRAELDVLASVRINQNYQRVLERISAAAREAGRDPNAVRLVVVTKGHSIETTQAVISAGARILGENYVEEALPKMQALSGEIDLQWHMIGHVQSRKARPVCEHFACVHSVDSLKLAERMDRFAAEFGKRQTILLECNVSREESKFGWKAWEEGEWNRLADDIAPLLELRHLIIRGLMTMPPFFADPEASRPYFQRLRDLQSFLATRFPEADWSQLSIGMSADYEVAIQEGATFVRVGTAILGERPR
jgi:pyridoxal phosphate enzyme (YggS family)